MWLPGAGVGGEDLTAKNAKGAKKEGTLHEGKKDTKNEFKKVNHKGHNEHIGREARKIKFLRPLRLSHPKGTAIAVPLFVTYVLFVVNLLSYQIPQVFDFTLEGAFAFGFPPVAVRLAIG
jgi:hypothetical protein